MRAYYDDGQRTIYCGDARDVLPCLQSASVDMVLTDSPWMDYVTGWYDASSHHAAVTFLHPKEFMPELQRIAKDATPHVFWCRWDCFELHRVEAIKAGFDVRNQIVWAKPNHTAGDLEGNLGNQHECAVFAVKGEWKRTGKREVNLWTEAHLFSRTFRYHPTEKPVGLFKRAASLCCKDGVILDPFCGSGTTLRAAKDLGLRAIGIEINERYCEIAARRLAQEVLEFAV